MTWPTVSVVIVSRGRAADLPLCLRGVSQLDYPSFEVVLVVDPQGHAAAHRMDLYDHLKIVPFDEANISAARNLGIAAAAGEIVAFIDDDAVPEPTWLHHLASAFSDPDVACAGGFVRGRNGISFQWKSRTVDETGRATALDVDAQKPTVLTPLPDRAVKTEGTNMAMRRDMLAQMGGFDPAYRFFLDETDLNMRLAKLGAKTVVVPMAQVHHGYKASATRRADRVPLDLFEIGASQAVFLRKYAPASQHSAALDRFKREQAARLDRLLISGALEPGDTRRIMRRLLAGYQAGKDRPLNTLRALPKAATGFQPMPPTVFGHDYFFGRRWQKASRMSLAKTAVSQGKRASVFLFGPSVRRHSVRYIQPGIWVQSGGVFGKSDRETSRVPLTSFKSRCNLELQRISGVRDRV